MKAFLSIAALTIGFGGAAGAAAFDGLINPNSGGLGVPAATWDFDGATLGLAGLRDAEVGDEISLSILNSLSALQSGGFLGLYVGDASIFDETVSAGDRIDGTLTLAKSGTLFDSLFVTYGANVVTQSVGGGTTTFGTQVRLDGQPDAFDTTSPVPLPAALPLLLAGLGGMGIAARKRRRAVA